MHALAAVVAASARTRRSMFGKALVDAFADTTVIANAGAESGKALSMCGRWLQGFPRAPIADKRAVHYAVRISPIALDQLQFSPVTDGQHGIRIRCPGGFRQRLVVQSILASRCAEQLNVKLAQCRSAAVGAVTMEACTRRSKSIGAAPASSRFTLSLAPRLQEVATWGAIRQHAFAELDVAVQRSLRVPAATSTSWPQRCVLRFGLMRFSGNKVLLRSVSPCCIRVASMVELETLPRAALRVPTSSRTSAATSEHHFSSRRTNVPGVCIFAVHGADGDANGTTWDALRRNLLPRGCQIIALRYDAGAYLRESFLALAALYCSRISATHDGKAALAPAGFYILGLSLGCMIVHAMSVLREFRAEPRGLVFVDMQVSNMPVHSNETYLSIQLLQRLMTGTPGRRSALPESRVKGATFGEDQTATSILRRHALEHSVNLGDAFLLLSANSMPIGRLLSLATHFVSARVCGLPVLCANAENSRGFHNGIEVNARRCDSLRAALVPGDHFNCMLFPAFADILFSFVQSTARTKQKTPQARRHLLHAGLIARLTGTLTCPAAALRR